MENKVFIYLLEYEILLLQPRHVMKKQKVFNNITDANEFQNVYNERFDDRKLIHYEIKCLEIVNFNQLVANRDVNIDKTNLHEEIKKSVDFVANNKNMINVFKNLSDK